MIGTRVISAAAILLAAAAPPVPALPGLDGAEPQVRAAIREARDALMARPDSAAAWGRYGSMLDVHAFTTEATRAYEVAGELDTGDFRWPYLLAIAVSPDDPAASLAHLQQALDRNTEYAPLYLRYAAMMESMGRADTARASYERAIGLEQGNAYAHAGLGRCLLAVGDMDGAKDQLMRAIELDTLCRPALSALAAHARRTGDIVGARRWSYRASNAPRTQPRDPVLADVRKLGVSTTDVIRRANELQEAGRTDAAGQTLEWLVRQNPESVRGRNKLGEFYLGRNDVAAAEQQFRAALSVEPDFVPARLGLAHLLTRNGRHDEGELEYETVLAGHPTSVPAHRGLAISLAAQGRMEASAEHFARVMTLAPDDRRARIACGSALIGSGQFERAADVLEALVSDPDAPVDELRTQARLALANALGALAERSASEGDLETTSAHLARAGTLLGDATSTRMGLAKQYVRSAILFTQRDEWSAAIELLRSALVVYPRSALINNELAWLLATCPERKLRNGAEAVELAERATELTGGNSGNELDTLAAAYAEAGRLDEAIATAERALEAAKRTGSGDLETQIAERLRQLRARRPSP